MLFIYLFSMEDDTSSNVRHFHILNKLFYLTGIFFLDKEKTMVKEDRTTWKAKYTMRLTVSSMMIIFYLMCSAILSFFGNIEKNPSLRASLIDRSDFIFSNTWMNIRKYLLSALIMLVHVKCKRSVYRFVDMLVR